MTFVLREPSPNSPDGVHDALSRRLTCDLARHARSVERRATRHPWSASGDTLVRAVWACVHGALDQPILMPNGDAAPARTVVESYGLQALCERRLAASLN